MEYLVLGLMTGTSLDGLDVALVKIIDNGSVENIELIDGETFPYSKKVKSLIRDVLNEKKCTARIIGLVNFELSNLCAFYVNKFLEERKIKNNNISVIGYHGQTIYHSIEEDTSNFSYQIGDGIVLAKQTAITVVNNFRSADIVFGGNGAPLVPYFDYVMFKDKNKTRVLHNIGGISNITVLPKNADLREVYAFDTGPGNVLINEATEILFHQPYDNNGLIAASESFDEEFVEEILRNAYFLEIPPKSTGRELFGRKYVEDLIDSYQHLSNEKIVSSFTFATASSIALAYQMWVFPFYEVDEIIFSGGGIYNLTLMEYLKELLPDVSIKTTEELGINPDFKEAMAFALLAHETINKRKNNVPNATGANKHTILGQICLPE